jgi:hypothetical protein
MPNYRRAFVPGVCWFYTVNLLERNRKLLVEHVDALRDAFDQHLGRMSEARRMGGAKRYPSHGGEAE